MTARFAVRRIVKPTTPYEKNNPIELRVLNSGQSFLLPDAEARDLMKAIDFVLARKFTVTLVKRVDIEVDAVSAEDAETKAVDEQFVDDKTGGWEIESTEEIT